MISHPNHNQWPPLSLLVCSKRELQHVGTINQAAYGHNFSLYIYFCFERKTRAVLISCLQIYWQTSATREIRTRMVHTSKAGSDHRHGAREKKKNRSRLELLYVHVCQSMKKCSLLIKSAHMVNGVVALLSMCLNESSPSHQVAGLIKHLVRRKEKAYCLCQQQKIHSKSDHKYNRGDYFLPLKLSSVYGQIGALRSC